MTHDDWQSFLASDLGKDLVEELKTRVRSYDDLIHQFTLAPLSDLQKEILNKQIIIRNVYSDLSLDFNKGYFKFIDDPEIDNV